MRLEDLTPTELFFSSSPHDSEYMPLTLAILIFVAVWLWEHWPPEKR
jgi:hypothetical protein